MLRSLQISGSPRRPCRFEAGQKKRGRLRGPFDSNPLPSSLLSEHRHIVEIDIRTGSSALEEDRDVDDIAIWNDELR